jgi:K+-sensing histidine kinase KdpD
MTIHSYRRPTDVAVRRSLARWNLELHRGRPAIRYGFSLVCVAVALGAARASQYYRFRDVELPILDLAIVVITWYAGAGPSVLAVVLSAACYNYFLTEPFYSFEVSNEDLPRFILFTVSAAIIAWFVAVRRRIESDLRHTRDDLQVEVEQRKRREDEIRKLNQELAKRAKQILLG